MAQPFEPFLDWNDFGVWIAEADLPDVEAILRGFTPQQKAAKMVSCATGTLIMSGWWLGDAAKHRPHDLCHVSDTVTVCVAVSGVHTCRRNCTAPPGMSRTQPSLEAYLMATRVSVHSRVSGKCLMSR